MRNDIKRAFERIDRQDTRVQLMRIAACLIVICCHIRLRPFTPGGEPDMSTLAVNSFFYEGVCIFFCITGFFLFRTKSYKKLLKRSVLKILLPATVLVLATLLINDWATGKRSLIDCITAPDIDWSLFGLSLLAADPHMIMHTAHLWYIVTYMFIIVSFPVLRLICAPGDNAKKARKLIFLIGVIGIVLQDVQQIFIVPRISVFSIFPITFVYVIAGYSLYERRDMFRGSIKARLLAIAGIIAATVLRLMVQQPVLLRVPENDYFFHSSTFPGVIFTISFVILFLTFGENKGKVRRVVNFLGGNTFNIYLLHVLVYAKLASTGVRKAFEGFFIGRIDTLFGEIGYTVSYCITVFLITLAISLIFKGVAFFLKCSGRKLFKKTNE